MTSQGFVESLFTHPCALSACIYIIFNTFSLCPNVWEEKVKPGRAQGCRLAGATWEDSDVRMVWGLPGREQ